MLFSSPSIRRRQLDTAYGHQDRTIAWASSASRREPEQLRGGVTPHPQGRAKTDPCDVEARMTPTATFVGIDIAKADFVVACRPDGTGIASK